MFTQERIFAKKKYMYNTKSHSSSSANEKTKRYLDTINQRRSAPCDVTLIPLRYVGFILQISISI